MKAKLVRNKSDGKLAGVCAGIADFTGVDVTLIRIAFVLFGIFGVGEVVYIIIWLIAPKAT